MQLAYLDFEHSEDAEGGGTLDAMASVDAGRLPALLAEIEAVMAWAARSFGPAAPLDEGGDWDFALDALDAHEEPLEIAFEQPSGRVRVESGAGRTTVTFTVTGSQAFCQALLERFPPQA